MGILRTDKISGLETPTAVTNSVLFDGNDYLSIAEVPELKLGNTDFTIEAWINFGDDVSDEHQNIIAAGNPEAANSFVIQIRSGTSRLLDFRTDTRSDLSTSAIPLNEWTHIAVTKESDVVKLFVNGILENSATEAEDLTTAITAIGYRSASSYGYVNGYISNLRVIKGRALYTADFTVPVHALEVIDDTVLLCCNNPDSVTAASNAGIGTAHVLTANGDPTVSTVNPGLTRDFTSGTEFRGVTTFDTQGYFVPPSGTTEQRGRGRGLFGGAMSPSFNDTIDLINIPSMGNAVDFGDIFTGRYTGACSSSTRAVFGGGEDPSSVTNVMDFVTIATNSDAINFGDLTQARRQAAGCSSQTRGLFGGGSTPTNVDTIDFITIASKGDAEDFGNLTVARRGVMSCSSPVRGVWAGGIGPGSTFDVIDYVTISSTGNALDFGDLTTDRRNIADGGCSSQVRGVFAGGRRVPADANSTVIDYITIASTGNAQDFGDITTATAGVSACSTLIRGVFAGGYQPTIVNTMEYVTIASTGDAKDFGDLTITGHSRAGCSDSHGGIS